MRLSGLIKKEAHQIVRDPSSIAIAFVLPVILLILFGYGVSLDAEHVPIAVVVEHPGSETAGFVAGFRESRYFTPTLMNTSAGRWTGSYGSAATLPGRCRAPDRHPSGLLSMA